MLKISNIFLLFLICLFSGCRIVPDGTPPENIIEIKTSDMNDEQLSLAEAVNMVSTELAVEVFSGKKDSIRILFKNNSAAEAVTRRLYQELKNFQPVKSVLNNEDFVLESRIGTGSGGKAVWQLTLRNRQNKIVWSTIQLLKDGEKL